MISESDDMWWWPVISTPLANGLFRRWLAHPDTYEGMWLEYGVTEDYADWNTFSDIQGACDDYFGVGVITLPASGFVRPDVYPWGAWFAGEPLSTPKTDPEPVEFGEIVARANAVVIWQMYVLMLAYQARKISLFHLTGRPG